MREILKSRVISSDNDQLAVVFYGTVSSVCTFSRFEAMLRSNNMTKALAVQRESQNNNAFESIYTYQDLDMPDAQRIRGLEALLGNFPVYTQAV